MSQDVTVRFTLQDDTEPEDFVDLLRSLGLDCVQLVNDGFGHMLPRFGEAEMAEDEHERAHDEERRGGERVDRRVCQGIGCPYGDH